ncbi:MAG: hypothetical protein AAGA88_13805 [Pseudomonadota bacterium]
MFRVIALIAVLVLSPLQGVFAAGFGAPTPVPEAAIEIVDAVEKIDISSDAAKCVKLKAVDTERTACKGDCVGLAAINDAGLSERTEQISALKTLDIVPDPAGLDPPPPIV